MTAADQTHERDSVLFRCLSHSRRRHVLDCLNESERPLALADLAEDVADRETDAPRAEIADEAVTDVHVALHHNHVPKLVDAGLVDYDRERNVVALTDDRPTERSSLATTVSFTP